MNRLREVASLFLVQVLGVVSFTFAQSTEPAPTVNRILVRDGDAVVIPHDARVRVIRRHEAHIRAVFNAQEQWLILLLDYEQPGVSDGRVDTAFYFNGVKGAWPLGERWEGAAALEEYSFNGQGTRGYGIETRDGLVQVLSLRQELRDPGARAVLVYSGGGGGGAVNFAFDDAERFYTSELRRNDGVMRFPQGAAVRGSVSGGVSFGGTAADKSAADTNGAVRVGGAVRPPAKILHVAAQRPDEAARAGITGLVIVELTVDVDGSVKNARILRSIELLDAAALEAVRQWRFEPTVIDGRAVPIIMTVSVEF